jgi:hypothetical protein
MTHPNVDRCPAFIFWLFFRCGDQIDISSEIVNTDLPRRLFEGETRRDFLKTSAAAAVALAGAKLANFASGAPAEAGKQPWYRRAVRWGQTNINEMDPTRYDIPWWREEWKRTRIQGVVINAGGIVAYYPTQVPMHRRAKFLGDHDLFGDLTRAAHSDGLAVFARMDSSGANEDFYHAHPDWFSADAEGRPYRARDLYVPCINGPYYAEHIATILREISARYQPEGFTDNLWSGLERNRICYCANCAKKFRAQAGRDLPSRKDWQDPGYRAWIEWGYACRLEVWDESNRIARAAGGPDCVWVGMNGGSPYGEAQEFRDFKKICQRSEIIMLDDQRRMNATGFQRNGEVGKLVHGVLGWDKVLPESMAMYQTTDPTFRLAAKPEPEARLWMIEGIAGGIQPWWHYLGAYGEDRRYYRTPVELCQWHAANEAYLVHRRPVANVGVVWSQRSGDFFGRDDWSAQAALPADGFLQALVHARIPYLPVEVDDIERYDSVQFRLLILPNIGALSDPQVASVRRFVEGGGGLLATGFSSLCDEWGDPRPDFALADLFGAHLPAAHGGRKEETRRRWAAETLHSYLRLSPELRGRVDGPHIGAEPPIRGERHPALDGFAETDILAFGGTLEPLTLDPSAQALATFIPSFPVSPPEDDWMRTPKTDIPGLIVNEKAGRGRVAFLPADLDRRFARDNLPDHGRILANLVRWASRDELPLSVEGPGLIDCHLYHQPGRMVLHLVNLTSAGTWRAPVDELIPVGPFQVRVRLPSDVPGKNLRLLVSGRQVPIAAQGGWARFDVPSILDHEVIAIS